MSIGCGEIKHILHKAQNQRAFTFERNAAYDVLIEDLFVVYGIVVLRVVVCFYPLIYCKILIIQALF